MYSEEKMHLNYFNIITIVEIVSVVDNKVVLVILNDFNYKNKKNLAKRQLYLCCDFSVCRQTFCTPFLYSRHESQLSNKRSQTAAKVHSNHNDESQPSVSEKDQHISSLALMYIIGCDTAKPKMES